MRLTARPSRRKPELQTVHEEISDLLGDSEEDRFSCPKAIRKKAMDFLARREYGQAELIRKLADKGYKRSLVEEAIGNLTSEGLQSDRRFVESFVQSRVNQGKGPVRIRLDLGQRAVSDAVVDAVLGEAATDWVALAREVRVKKFGRGYPSDFKARAQQMRFLQYRGFEQDHIQKALAFEGRSPEDD